MVSKAPIEEIECIIAENRGSRKTVPNWKVKEGSGYRKHTNNTTYLGICST